MADVYSTIVSTIQVLQALKETISEYRNQEKAIEDLYNEIEATLAVLNTLDNLAKSGRETSEVLDVPLKQCTRKCEELKRLVEECTTHAHGSRRSLRDFLSLKWNGKDISDFRNQLNSYKLTVIAATITTIMSRESVSEKYILENQLLINATIPDLRQRLDKMNKRLEALSYSSANASAEDLAERSRLLDDKDSTIRCMEICNTALEDLKKRYHEVFFNSDGAFRKDNPISAMTEDALKESQLPLEKMLGGLGKRLERVETQLEADDLKSQLRVTESFNHMAEQKLVNLRNVAAGKDASQFILSNGAGLNGNNVRAAEGALQVCGSASDVILQHISSNHHATRQSDRLDTRNVGCKNELSCSCADHGNRSISKSPVLATQSLQQVSFDSKGDIPMSQTIGTRWRLIEVVRSIGRKPRYARQDKKYT